MWQRNNGQGESESLQNRFTAYLVLSVRRKKRNYIIKKYTQQQHEIPFEETLDQSDQHELSDVLPLMMRLENESLCYALGKLNEREWKVFISRALDERSFADMGKELGLGYKGVAAIYYRAIQKIRKIMEDMNKDGF